MAPVLMSCGDQHTTTLRIGLIGSDPVQFGCCQASVGLYPKPLPISVRVEIHGERQPNGYLRPG